VAVIAGQTRHVFGKSR